ncbi:MAG: hypothetical protein IKU60_03785 [Clostridia bacterium]|nr:hypothetical protein [Clostridia bacterium]
MILRDLFFQQSEADWEKRKAEKDNADLIAFIREEFGRRKQERMPYELRWTLNANFYMGNQYCDINTYRDFGIEQLLPLNKQKEREVYNRIAPIIETRAANLQKIDYAMSVKPRRNDVDDAAKADVCSKIINHMMDVSGFNQKKNQAIMWNEITGGGFWVCGWNSAKGRVTTIEEYTELEEDGSINVKRREVHEGDVEYSLLSNFEVYPDDVMVEGIENQNSIMVVQVINRKEAYDRYNIKTDGETIQTFTVTPKPISYGIEKECTGNILSQSEKRHAVRIITYYEKPGREFPNGRCITMADVEEGVILYNGELPGGIIPLSQFKCKSIPGQFFGKSVIEDLIPLQRAYNDAKNSVGEYIKRLAVGELLAEEGSIDVDSLEMYGRRDGRIIEYKQGSQKPTNMPIDRLPGEVITTIEKLENDMEYVSGVSQMQMVGAAPSGIKSGKGIEELKEIDNTRMAQTGEYMRESVKGLAVMWLVLYKRYSTIPRVVECVGLNEIGNALIFTSEDITSYEVDFDAQNQLIVSEDMQLERFKMFMSLGYFADENGVTSQRVKNFVLQKAKLGNFTEIMDMNSLQVQSAQRETVYMRQGMFCDINSYDDDEIHAEEHKRFILSAEFEQLRRTKPQWAELVLAHYSAHEARCEQKKAQMPAVM